MTTHVSQVSVVSQQTRTVVVGAGIGGLSAALLLAQARPSDEIELWEAREQPGGLLAPVHFAQVECDRGSHRVHPQADPLLLSLTHKEQWLERPRNGRLILNQRQLPYPPKLLPFLRGLGLQTTLSMGLGFVLRPASLGRFLQWESDRTQALDEDEGFAHFVIERVGRSAYDAFYRPYVEKVWGLSPEHISRSVAKQRVSTSSPWQTLSQALKWRPKAQQGSFLYPRWGMASLIRSLKEQVEQAGVEIHYGKQVSSLHDIDADRILYSGHLGDIVPGSGLSHRGLYLVYMAFPDGTLQDVDTWYAPEADYWFGRVSQLSKFSPSLKASGREVLCIEIPEGRWGPKVDFLSQQSTLMQQLVGAGVVPGGARCQELHQVFIPRVYPMYRRYWLRDWQEALEHLAQDGRVFPIGRQGLFLHCNIDHSVRISQDAVSHMMSGQSARAWLRLADRYLDLRVRD